MLAQSIWCYIYICIYMYIYKLRIPFLWMECKTCIFWPATLDAAYRQALCSSWLLRFAYWYLKTSPHSSKALKSALTLETSHGCKGCEGSGMLWKCLNWCVLGSCSWVRIWHAEKNVQDPPLSSQARDSWFGLIWYCSTTVVICSPCGIV